jgi:hypothetical protein
MKKLFNAMLVFLLLIVFSAHAQENKVTGTISDAKTGDPAVGASIVIKNSMIGASADFDD